MRPVRIIGILTLSIGLITGCTTSSELQKQADKTIDASPPVLTEVNTGYLKATPGYRGDMLGAQIESISMTPTGDQQVIELSIPIDPKRVDRVEVISISGELVKQNRKAEILGDYETSNVGIKLFLPRRKDWSFRLRLIDIPDNE